MSTIKQLPTISYDKEVDNDTYQQDTNALDKKANESIKSPAERGSESVSGSTPSPDSDDNVLANAHAVGIALESDLEHLKELDIAEDVKKAEMYNRAH